MTSTHSTHRTDPLGAVLDVADAPSCAVCGHPLAGHDAIGLRYCDATQANALTRGCICPKR